jgi:hypothetical protein
MGGHSEIKVLSDGDHLAVRWVGTANCKGRLQRL